MIQFHVGGDPQGKGRARAFRRGNFIGHYTPEKTRTYEGIIRYAAQQAMNGAPPAEGPLSLTVRICITIPASWSKKKRDQAGMGRLLPAKKPDLDNIVKAVTDACAGVVFGDDAQIVDLVASKMFASIPGVWVTVDQIPSIPATSPGSTVPSHDSAS
jgi:Holliday junction resolvase RusA-like endonuclease